MIEDLFRSIRNVDNFSRMRLHMMFVTAVYFVTSCRTSLNLEIQCVVIKLGPQIKVFPLTDDNKHL